MYTKRLTRKQTKTYVSQNRYLWLKTTNDIVENGTYHGRKEDWKVCNNSSCGWYRTVIIYLDWIE